MAERTGQRDHEGRRRSGVWLPDECWDWLDANKAEGLSRSDFLEGIILVAMDEAEERAARRTAAPTEGEGDGGA